MTLYIFAFTKIIAYINQIKYTLGWIDLRRSISKILRLQTSIIIAQFQINNFIVIKNSKFEKIL